MTQATIALATLRFALPASAASPGKYAGKKFLFIDSYHAGHERSDGIIDGVQPVLEGTGAYLEIVHMVASRLDRVRLMRGAGREACACVCDSRLTV